MIRHVLTAALVASTLTVLSGPSLAGPPTCRLLLDPTGDTTATQPTGTDPAPGGPFVPAEPSLDLVSADLASNRDYVTAVLRVAHLGAPAPTSPTGSSYLLSFLLNETRFTLYAIRDVTGWQRFLLLPGSEVGTQAIAVDGTFDTARNEVRISATTEDFEQLGGRAHPGTQATELTAATQRALGAAGSYTFQTADAATAKRNYRLGSASCVTPGR